MGFDLDNTEEKMLRNDLNEYGAVIHGGRESERVEAVESVLESDYVIIDGRDCGSINDFVNAVISNASGLSRSDIEQLASLPSVEDQLLDTGCGIVVNEFDAMRSSVQYAVGKRLFNLAENPHFEYEIAYLCNKPSAVASAYPKLDGEVRGWEINYS